MSSSPHSAHEYKSQKLAFSDLKGWLEDDHDAALHSFKTSAHKIQHLAQWHEICAHAQSNKTARSFFETYFQPTLYTDESTPLITGYYEPEFEGSLSQTETYNIPVFAPPQDPRAYDRTSIDRDNVLLGRNLEILWLKSWIDLYTLHIQGSGRVLFQNGDSLSVQYAADNGCPYVSIGKKLIEQGLFTAQSISADAITTWLTAHPVQGRALTWENPRYIFFKLNPVQGQSGPNGTLDVALTPLRSIAVDERVIQLGTPVWLETEGPPKLNRLMIAQDTGGAICGTQRADIYFGTGKTAAHIASSVKHFGRLLALEPKGLSAHAT